MNKPLLCVTLLLVLAGCGEKPKDGDMTAHEVASELASLKIEPGEWEATNEIVSASAPGLPKEAMSAMIGKKTTARNCVTPEQAAKPNANFLAAQKNSNCTYQDFSMKGGKMTGTMTCQGGEMPGKTVMTMNGEYGPTSYGMTMDMATSGLPAGMTMTVKARTTGKRVGDCS